MSAVGLVTKPRCEMWAHAGGELGERCQRKIVGKDGKLWPCLARVVLYDEASGLPVQESENVTANPQVNGGGNGGRGRLSEAERARRYRVRRLMRAIDRGAK